jgi:hypothetical protein
MTPLADFFASGRRAVLQQAVQQRLAIQCEQIVIATYMRATDKNLRHSTTTVRAIISCINPASRPTWISIGVTFLSFSRFLASWQNAQASLVYSVT